MCEFKPGDEVVCVKADGHEWECLRMTPPEIGAVYTVTEVFITNVIGSTETGVALSLKELPSRLGAYPAECFDLKPKRNDRLTIEAFFTIPGGFEEPKRTPAKRRERA